MKRSPQLGAAPAAPRLPPLPLVLVAAISMLVMAMIAMMFNPRGTDFGSYYAATERVRAGQPLYVDQATLLADYKPFVYPPVLPLLLLAFPTVESAWQAWQIISWALLLGAIALLATELDLARVVSSGPLRVLGLIGLLFFPPLLHHMMWGQIQIALLALIVGVWWAVRHDRPLLAGGLLALAIALKLYPALLLLPLALAGRWRTVAVAALGSAALALGGYAIVGWDQLAYYAGTVLPLVQQHLGYFTFEDNHTVAGTLLMWGAGQQLAIAADTAWRVLAGAAFVAGSLVGRRQLAPLLAAAMTTTVLVSPVIWSHYFVLLYLPWLTLLPESSRRERWLLALSFALAATGPLVVILRGPIVPVLHGLPTLGIIILLSIQYLHIWRRVSAAQATA